MEKEEIQEVISAIQTDKKELEDKITEFIHTNLAEFRDKYKLSQESVSFTVDSEYTCMRNQLGQSINEGLNIKTKIRVKL